MSHINKLVKELSRLSKPQIAFFGALTCEKMYPNYLEFYQSVKWGNIEILDEALIVMYQYINDGKKVQATEVSSIKKQLFNVSPNTNDSTSHLASYALDTCSAFDEVLTFLINDNIEHIENAITNALDTVDMFIQEKDDLDPDEPNLEEIIISDEFMIREKERQVMLLKEIKLYEILSMEVITKIREINNGTGNIVDLSLLNLRD